jgi:hypothetical protein
MLDPAASDDWKHGRTVPSSIGDARPTRAYDETGHWLGVGRFDPAAAAWRPAKVVGVAA